LVDCLPDKQIKLIKTGVSVELRGQLARRAGKEPDGIVSNPSRVWRRIAISDAIGSGVRTTSGLIPCE
jgi:hypothetical protein